MGLLIRRQVTSFAGKRSYSPLCFDRVKPMSGDKRLGGPLIPAQSVANILFELSYRADALIM
jgi:hypothetical protein